MLTQKGPVICQYKRDQSYVNTKGTSHMLIQRGPVMSIQRDQSCQYKGEQSCQYKGTSHVYTKGTSHVNTKGTNHVNTRKLAVCQYKMCQSVFHTKRSYHIHGVCSALEL